MNYSELLQLSKGWGNFVSDRIIIWRLPYSVWLENPEEEDRLYNHYCSVTANDKERISLAIELLLENPYHVRNYEIIYSIIRSYDGIDNQFKHMKELENIAQLFHDKETSYEKSSLN